MTNKKMFKKILKKRKKLELLESEYISKSKYSIGERVNTLPYGSTQWCIIDSIDIDSEGGLFYRFKAIPNIYTEKELDDMRVY